MRSLVRLTEYSKEDIFNIFKITDELKDGKYKDLLKGKTIVMFFPESSIRTRVTFEKGIYLLGGQTILFPPSTLEKREELEDVIGYLNNWVDAIIVRYKDIKVIDDIRKFSKVPVINAMTDINHPCEILSDLYTLSKIRKDFLKDKYVFVGANENIGLAWKEASQVMGFSLCQSSPKKYMMEGVEHIVNLKEAVAHRDIICNDSKSPESLDDFRDYVITMDIMNSANENAIVNPCPPFYREEDVSTEVINSKYFVGYEFKKHLLEVQQAILIYNILY